MENILTESTYDTPDKNLDIKFDLSHVTKDDAKRQYYNFLIFRKESNLLSLLFEDNSGNYIHKNRTISVPAEEVKHDISTAFFLEDWQFQIQICENNIACAFYIPNTGENINLLIKSMEQLGWFKSRIIDETLYLSHIHI